MGPAQYTPVCNVQGKLCVVFKESIVGHCNRKVVLCYFSKSQILALTIAGFLRGCINNLPSSVRARNVGSGHPHFVPNMEVPGN